MNRLLQITWLKYLSLLGLLLLLLSACEQQDLSQASGVLDRSLPDESSNKVRITELNGDQVDYELYAERIDRFYDRRLLNAFGVQIRAFDPKTGGTTNLKADSTIVDDARNMIFAYGNVLLSSPGGSVSSASMIWDRNLDEITAAGRVTVVRDGNTLRGQNLRTNPQVDFAEMDVVSADGLYDATDFDW